MVTGSAVPVPRSLESLASLAGTKMLLSGQQRTLGLRKAPGKACGHHVSLQHTQAPLSALEETRSREKEISL